MRNALRTLACLLCLALAAGLAFLLIRQGRQTSLRRQTAQTLAAQARPYETELARLRREQSALESAVTAPQGPGAALIGYKLSRPEDLDLIAAQAARYGFTPILLLDCQDEDLAALLRAMYVSEAHWPAAVTYTAFSEATPAEAAELTALLAEYGYPDSGIFLLRGDDDTAAARQALLDRGFTALATYSDHLESADLGSAVQLGYSYVSKAGYTPAARLADLADSQQALLFAFNLDRLADGTFSEEKLTEVLGAVERCVQAGTVSYATAESAAETIRLRVAQETARRTEFEAQQAEAAARMAELEAKIGEIYSHWDEVSE